MLRLRHSFLLIGEIFGYARVNRAWWVLPVFGVLALAMLVAVAGGAAAPWTMYTLF